MILTKRAIQIVSVYVDTNVWPLALRLDSRHPLLQLLQKWDNSQRTYLSAPSVSVMEAQKKG